MPICLECSLVQQIIQLPYYNLLASMASKNLCANQESNVQLYHIWLSTMMSNWTTYNVCEYFSCWKENVDPWQRPMFTPICPQKKKVMPTWNGSAQVLYNTLTIFPYSMLSSFNHYFTCTLNKKWCCCFQMAILLNILAAEF